jgi:hypothetical protein
MEEATQALHDAPLYADAIPDFCAALDAVRALIRKYVVVGEHEQIALTLFVAHTHFFKAAEATPYLQVTSAVKQSGKTRLLEVLELLVARPWLTGRVTPAVLNRKIHRDHPTLLLDESDAAFKQEREYGEALRGILNSGHRRGGKSSVCVARGQDYDFQDFDVFCPKVIAGIGRLPDTIEDRSIRIELHRRAVDEPIKRFRRREAVSKTEPIRDRLEALIEESLGPLTDARPQLPDELGDRAGDGWEPLLAIADLAGGHWPESARAAAVALSQAQNADDAGIEIQMLVDIRSIFDRADPDVISSARLAESLIALEERPWGDWRRGSPMTTRSLAKLLRPFGIRPRTVRLGDSTLKGYRVDQFRDAWRRYLPLAVTSDTSGTSEAAPTGET